MITEYMKTMIRSNTNEAKEAFEKHVLSFYSIDDLKADLKACATSGNTYQRGLKLADSGCFLIYLSDVAEFINSTLERNEKPTNKTWNMYKHLVALAIERLVK